MWLGNIGMIQYYDNFIKHGFGDVMEPLFDLTDYDLEKMGIEMVAHKKIILKRIEKHKQQMNEGQGGVVGITVDGDSSDGDDLFETAGKTTEQTVQMTGNVNDSEGDSDDDDINSIYDKKTTSKRL